jgi:hypothetical protein
VPCVASLSVTGVTQRLELQAFGVEANGASVVDQLRAVGRDEMRHGAPFPNVAMKPEPAGHGIDHSFSPFPELAPWRREVILLATTY